MGKLRCITTCLSARPSRLLNLRQFSTAKPSSSAETSSSEPVVGPGGPSDRILGMYEQSAGLERLEYLSNLAKRPLFLMEPLNLDHFGTLQNPIRVQSLSGERIVGCSGFPVDGHELMWFNVKEGRPGRCPECGQAFVLEMVNQQHHH